MPRANANNIEIEFDTFGDSSDPAVLLVMGLGAQLTVWDPEFCAAIARQGYYVIRFDNRDIGLSTWLDHLGTHALSDVMAGTVTPSYTLSDMAHDAAGLLDALGIASAHVVGASMGGMIAQTIAIEHPHRTRLPAAPTSVKRHRTLSARCWVPHLRRATRPSNEVWRHRKSLVQRATALTSSEFAAVPRPTLIERSTQRAWRDRLPPSLRSPIVRPPSDQSRFVL